jgi:hypothetical protein
VSYDQTFKGKFEFADAHCLEAGLDRFAACLKNSIVDLETLEIDGLTVKIDMDCSAPASMYDETTYAIGELGSQAKSGAVLATFTLDGTDRERIRSGGRSSSEGLPDRHHRWEAFFAAKAGDASALRALADRGISLAQGNDGYYGWSALHLAARAGASEAVGVCLQAGVDPNIASPHGATPLSVASTAEVAQMLLDAGADKDRPVGESVAIAIAYDHDHFEVAEVLLGAGAKIPKLARRSILVSLAHASQIGAIQRLVKHDPGFVEVLADPELMDIAIASDNAVLVDYLLEHGAKLPETFVEDTISAGSVTLAETALRLPDALSRCGLSSGRKDAMCSAADGSNLAMMQLLARHGVPLHPEQPGTTSPIHSVASSWEDNAVECMKWLLDEGVPIDAADEDGKTPLMVAGEYCRTAVVELLLERGADRSALAKLSADDRASLRKAMGKKWGDLVGVKKKKPAAKKKKPAKKKKAAAKR